MPTYSCDTSGNGLFYWAVSGGGVPTYGGMIVATHQDGSYSVNFPDGPGTDGSPQGSTTTYMAPDYVDPGCTHVGGGVYLPTAQVAPPLSLAPRAQVAEEITPQLCITVDAIGEAPYGYQLTQTERFAPESISVQWDGTAAAGSFKPCVSFYSSSGHLIGRTFPPQDLASGDTAEVTYGPF